MTVNNARTDADRFVCRGCYGDYPIVPSVAIVDGYVQRADGCERLSGRYCPECVTVPPHNDRGGGGDRRAE